MLFTSSVSGQIVRPDWCTSESAQMLDVEAEVQRTEKWQLINIKNRNTKQETVETHREECCLVTCSRIQETSEGSLSFPQNPESSGCDVWSCRAED